MALTDDNGVNATMLMQPAYGTPYGGGYGGGGLFGGNNDLLGLLFVIALCNGGFGGFGFGGGYGAMLGMGGMWGMDMLYPWLNNSQNINDGFRDAQLHDSVTSVRDAASGLSTQLCNCCGDMQISMLNGFNGVNTNLCNGFNGVNNSIFGAQTAISQQLNSNELASLNRSFAEQTANAQGFNNVQAQLAQCCCDNRLATAQTQALVQSENCADRYEAAKNTQGIISAITAGIQSIKDDLCADRLDAERRENQNLRTQLSMAQLAASQVEQTAQLRASQATTANQLVSELRSCPIPAQPVYGNQPIFACPQTVNSCGCNNGCGCGNNF